MTTKAADTGPDPLPRLQALDGVRGLAILLVMLHHFTWLPKDSLAHKAVFGVRKLGWSGVDLFFVLSGYLITSILIEYRGDAKYYSIFYARRALRIIPLYYVVLALSLFVLPLVLDVPDLGGNTVWWWLHASNWYLAFHGMSHKTLDVCWSLSIEEQFYLVWPLVVGLTPPRLLSRVALGVFAASSLLLLVMSGAGAPWSMVYTLTPCRLGGLALGGFLATIPQTKLRSSGKVALVTGAIGAVGSLGVVVVTKSSHMDGRFGAGVGWTALAVMWASLVVLSMSVRPVNRAFSLRPLTFLGKYSYCLYLVHMPVNFLVRDTLFGPTKWPRIFGNLLVAQLLFDALAMGISILVALMSWRLLEEPILRLKKHFLYAAMQRTPDRAKLVAVTTGGDAASPSRPV
ncbi:MAG: acyltransferase [Polyangiaceae bacterium]